MSFDFPQIGPRAIAIVLFFVMGHFVCYYSISCCGNPNESLPKRSASVRLWPANRENALKRAPAQLAERDKHRISNEQKCDHQGAVAPSSYHVDHDHFSTFIAAQLYIPQGKKCMPQVSKPCKSAAFRRVM